MSNETSFIFQHNAREVMRISATGITIPEDLTVDEAAQGVIAVLDKYIVGMVQRAVEKEREECAKVAALWQNFDLAAAIRARGE